MDAVDNLILHVGPLRDYGSFDWYAPLHRDMSDDFALVICDGPPGDIRGGRSRLPPVLGSHLRPGCMIMLDDVARPDEKALAELWSEGFSVPFQVCGVHKPFALLQLPNIKRPKGVEPYPDFDQLRYDYDPEGSRVIYIVGTGRCGAKTLAH